MITRWGVELPEFDDLPARPKGVVTHWTGGGPTANAVDLGAYHYVIEADGTVRKGYHDVADNMRQVREGIKYAKHTGAFNSYRIGIAAAGMKGYISRSMPGSFPLTEVQVTRMMEVAGFFIDMANLNPIDPAHLCSHREVWTILGIKGTTNHTKTDIEFLPFKPELKPHEVGYYLRSLAAIAIRIAHAPQPNVDPEPDEPTVVVPVPMPPKRREPPHLSTDAAWWRRLLARLRARLPGG